jgi:hypothetical protein
LTEDEENKLIIFGRQILRNVCVPVYENGTVKTRCSSYLQVSGAASLAG